MFATLLVVALLTGCPQKIEEKKDIPSRYKKVAYSDLAGYLASEASDTEINYIEVTGLAADNLTGFSESDLGAKFKAAATKKIALKLPAVPSLTNMKNAFKGCTSLVEVANIPAGVTNMSGCFSNCSALANPPVIPSTVTGEGLKGCFFACGGIRTAPNIPDGITDLSYSFDSCISLENGPVIPASVTKMEKCFFRCFTLKGAKLMCNYNTGHFDRAFDGCRELEDEGIKVPSAYEANYKASAAVTAMKGYDYGILDANKFKGE